MFVPKYIENAMTAMVPTTDDTGVLSERTYTTSPAKNAPKEMCIKTGRMPMMNGTCHISRFSCRNWRIRHLSRTVPEGMARNWYTHCFARTAISAVVKLKARLLNQRALTQMSVLDAWTADEGVRLEGGTTLSGKLFIAAR